VVFSLTLENTTRDAHSWYSNSSVGDIRDSTTKIIDITLLTRGIISDNFLKYFDEFRNRTYKLTVMATRTVHKLKTTQFQF
jgi:hypothetical protein